MIQVWFEFPRRQSKTSKQTKQEAIHSAFPPFKVVFICLILISTENAHLLWQGKVCLISSLTGLDSTRLENMFMEPGVPRKNRQMTIKVAKKWYL